MHPTTTSNPLPFPLYEELGTGKNKVKGFEGREESFRVVITPICHDPN